ncbi:MAG: hypothetical protein IJF07_07980 [Lachnospiraceae bacterium]|nr:hypothetical protein [Lachnospiraceae bacterium]
MNLSDLKRNAYMPGGSHAKRGYIRWWHTFTGVCTDTMDKRTFFIEYFIINPGLGADEPILGQHPYYQKRGLLPSYAMVKAGVFPDKAGNNGLELNAYYPISAFKLVKEPLFAQIEDCSFTEHTLKGSLNISSHEASQRAFMTDAGSMEWELEMHKAISCHTGAIANRFFTALHALESFWHGEGIRTLFRGTVTLNGVVYEVSSDNCYGYADKHWGRSYNKPWLQFASNHLISAKTGKASKHSALAIDGCCPRFLCFPLKRRLMIQLTYTGEDFEYNFARPLTLSSCKWKVKETNKRYIWRIMAQNKTSIIKISGSCNKELLIPIHYESPDGTVSKSPLLASGAGTGTVEIYRRFPGGAQLIDTLTIEDAFCEYQRSGGKK